MLAHDQIIHVQLFAHLHLRLIKFRQIFRLKPQINSDLIPVFLPEGTNRGGIFCRPVHSHMKRVPGWNLIRPGNVVRKAKHLHSGRNGRLYIFLIRADSVTAPHCMGMIICCQIYRCMLL